MNTEGQIDRRNRRRGRRRRSWIQIGHGSRSGHNYFDGTLVDGKLEAKARGTGFHLWTLEGKPAKH